MNVYTHDLPVWVQVCMCAYIVFDWSTRLVVEVLKGEL